ncbi:hypothetical protein LAT59_00265 [Candidatus Gracilibacteria bacterium]|nr:hypothetical protein [Candidatus Gracilibacteria bacterium]
MSYQEAPEARVNEEQSDLPRQRPENQDPTEAIRGLEVSVGNGLNEGSRMSDIMTQRLDALIREEEISTLSTTIEPTQEEMQTLQENGVEVGGEINPEMRRQIFEARIARIAETELPHNGEDGPIRLLEQEFVEGLAEERLINPQLLMYLRAIDFDGAQAWNPEEITRNYEALIDEISRIAESEGRDMSTLRTSEFLEIYNSLDQNDSVAATQTIDPAAAAAMGIDVRRDSNGGFAINPESSGYRQAPGGTVVGPAGSPSSTGGQVYQGRPNEISPDAGNITYDTLTEFTPDTQLTESQVSELRNPEHKEIIETRFPSQWYGIAIEFMNTAGDINTDRPIALASCSNLIAIVSYPGTPPRIEESPISIGRNGFGPQVRADHDVPGQRGDGRTQTGRVQNFNSVTIAGVGQRANQNAQTITGAEIRSPEGQERGGRWWHGGRDGRFPGQNSLGCVVAPDEFMIRLAEAVNRHGGGYGFQSEQATLPPQPSSTGTSGVA